MKMRNYIFYVKYESLDPKHVNQLTKICRTDKCERISEGRNVFVFICAPTVNKSIV